MKPTFEEIVRDNQLAVGKFGAQAVADALQAMADVGRMVFQEHQQALVATNAALGTIAQRRAATWTADVGQRPIEDIGRQVFQENQAALAAINARALATLRQWAAELARLN